MPYAMRGRGLPLRLLTRLGLAFAIAFVGLMGAGGSIASGLTPAAPPPTAPLAAPPVPSRPTLGLAAPKAPRGEYLLALPIALPDPATVPPQLTVEQADELAARLLKAQAAPLLRELKRRRSEGQVASFALRPDLHGVVVETGAAEALALSAQPGVTALLAQAEGWQCGEQTARALRQQLLALSAHASPSQPLATGATTISVYRYPDGSYSSVSGYTTPSAQVTMTILRSGGSVRVTRTTTSSSYGSYSFYPTWISCPDDAYDWAVHVGDTVQITVGGQTVSTVVVQILAWGDPVADTVAGLTAANRAVQVWAYEHTAPLCSSPAITRTVTSDSAGNFQVSYAGAMNLGRYRYFEVSVYDANGNRTYYPWFVPYCARLSADDGSYFYGYLKPNLPWTAQLWRGGVVIASASGVTTLDNEYWGSFTETMRVGDTLSVVGAGASASLVLGELRSVTLEPGQRCVSGAATAGRRLRGSFSKSDEWPVYTTCSYTSCCADIQVTASGLFTLCCSLDLERSDYVYLTLYDAEGNYQYYSSRSIPVIRAELSNTWLELLWKAPYTPINVVLRRGGTVRGTLSQARTSYDGSLSVSFGIAILPGDQVDMGDGVYTTTMTVQNVTAFVDSRTDEVYGQAPNGPMVIRLSSGNCSTCSTCRELTVAGGSYRASFTSTCDIRGSTYADVYFAGPDGHSTYLSREAFHVKAYLGSAQVGGALMTPGSTITLTLYSAAGALKASLVYALNASSTYFSGNLNPSSTLIATGDRLEVRTSDGYAATILIPELTANEDATNNRFYGHGPANQRVAVWVDRVSPLVSYYWSQWVNSDAQGNWAVSLHGATFTSYDCQPVTAGHACNSVYVGACDAAGHMVVLTPPSPRAVSADAFEDDNTRATASTYTAPQAHTFHAYPDDDWVRFTVPQSDIDAHIPYRVAISQSGVDMFIELGLYTVDGGYITTDYGERPVLLWQPPAAGTYYAKASPAIADATGHCDASYELTISAERFLIYLPLVYRTYEGTN